MNAPSPTRQPPPRILQAAAAIYEDATALQHLIAYIVLQPNSPALDQEQVKASLRTRLPPYMVPAWLEVIDTLPTLPSGKIDRKNLPAPKRSAAPGQPTLENLSPLESAIAAAWQRLTGSPIPSRSADFFRDLGGHSLLVARLASEVRQTLPDSDLAVADLYNHPTLEKLSAALTARTAARKSRPAPNPAPKLTPQNPRPHLLFAAAQSLCLYFIFAFYSLQWLTPYLAYVWFIEHDLSRPLSILGALGALLALYPLMLAATIILKWLLVGRLKPGNYPLYSVFHLRWWLMQRILDAVAVEYLEATPLLNLYYRLMGAKIGKRVHFRSYNIGAFDLVSVGDDTVLDDATSLLAYTIEHGHIRLAPIAIGKRCHIGAGSLLQLNTRMADDSRILHLSLLTEGTATAPHETWFGSPANRLLHADPLPEKPLPVSTARRLFFASLQTLGIFLLPVVYLAALFPGLILLNDLAIDYGETWSLLFAPAVAVAFIVLLLAEIIAVKWLLLGRVKEGDYPLYGWFTTRKWFVDQLMALSLDIMGPLYATLYLNPWYKALGAKLGRRAEISTASAASPDLLDVGEESFIADAVLLGPPTVSSNRLRLQKVRIGKRAFVGNSALIPPGAIIADSALIGVLSTTPLTSPGAAEPDTTWLGSPAIFLPQRQTSTGFAENLTFKPSRGLIALRLFIEFFRITLPMTFFVVFTSLLITTVVEIRPYLLPWAQVLIFPLLYAAAGLAATLFTIAAKWLLIGRYKPAEKPLWSSFVWRSELVNSLHENLACAYLMDMCLGTPLLNWYFRALGMKIGRNVHLDTPEFTEFDLVTLGDNAILNIEATIQTHLFEDRVMKMSTVSIGPNCSVGACAVILYDTALGRDSILEELSLVMKGESLPDASRWHGSPARRVASNAEANPCA